MKFKLNLSSIFSQLLLLFFVILWITPTFGLLISSFRDKDQLAISGWWTSLVTTEVNEILRTKGNKAQIEEEGIFFIRGNLFDNEEGKKVLSYGITSKDINAYMVGEIAILKDKSEIVIFENGDYQWKSKSEFKKKKGRRLFITAQVHPVLL